MPSLWSLARRALASLSVAVFAVLAPPGTPAQDLPEWREVPVPGETAPLRYAVLTPADHDPGRPLPVLLALPAGRADGDAVTAALAAHWGQAREHGFLVVMPAHGGRPERVLPLLERLRTTQAIAQGGIHLAGTGTDDAFRLALRQPWQFQSLTVLASVLPADASGLATLRHLRLRLHVGTDDANLVAECQRSAAALRSVGADASCELHHGQGAVPADLTAAELAQALAALHVASEPPGAEGAVAAALDAFHSAASMADEDRYFDLLPDDAVFLGTDPGERWTGAQFRAFAMPYFQRASAWIYVPRARHVTVAPGGAMAWFDEVVANDAYGDCRGTGVLALRDGRWRILQYDLTIPIPNDLARGVVARIRAFAAGRPAPVTTVIVVRHAEKHAEGDDPGLTAAGTARAATLAGMLRDLPVRAAFCSPFRRTRDTLAPLCAARGLTPVALPAADGKGLAARIREHHQGETVVVAGHSNTVPAILQALGVTEKIEMTEADYDRLYVVTLGLDGPRLLPLHF